MPPFRGREPLPRTAAPSPSPHLCALSWGCPFPGAARPWGPVVPFSSWALRVPGALFLYGCPHPGDLRLSSSTGPQSTPSFRIPRRPPFPSIHISAIPGPGVQHAGSQPCSSPLPPADPCSPCRGGDPSGRVQDQWGDAHLPHLWGAALPEGAMPCLCPRARGECQAELPPAACRAAPPTLCSLQTLLAPWLGRGSEHEADAPAVSIPAAFPCPASVPSPACAKPHQGHPRRARGRWLVAGTRSLQPGLGFTVKETGMSCRAAISILL